MPNRGKLIVFSAPSGSGKTTIVRALLQNPELNLAFSISASSRAPRSNEIHGKDYYFLSPEEFKKAIRDRKSTRLNSSHSQQSRMPSSA